jgi:hypothetical protein
LEHEAVNHEPHPQKVQMCVLLCLPHKPQFMGILHLILLVLFGSTQF